MILLTVILAIDKNRIAVIAGVLYLLWWSFCLSLSFFDPMGLKSVSDYTYLLIILNVVFFVIGYIGASRTDLLRRSSGGSLGVVYNYEERVHRSKTILCLLLALMLYLAFYFARYQQALAEVGPTQARNIRFFVGPVFRSTIEVLFFNFIIEALSNFLIVLVAYSLVIGKFYNCVSIAAIVDLVLFSLIGSGRGIIAEECAIIAFFSLILRYIFPSGSKKEKLYINRRLVIVKKKNIFLYGGIAIVGTLALLSFITAKRLDVHGLSLNTFIVGGKEFVIQSIIYTTGSFRALDYALQNADLFGFYLGRMTLAGVDEIFGYCMRGIGLDYLILNTSIGAVTGAPIEIGAGIMFNALYTCIFRFYYDFGISSVLAFSLFFGFCVRYSITIFSRKPTFVSFLIMAFMFKTSIFSIQNWSFAAPSAVIYLISLFGVYLRKRNKMQIKVPLISESEST